MKNERGFSLIELLVVVVIIGIVSAIAVIGYKAVTKGTRDSTQKLRLVKLQAAQQTFRTTSGKRRYGTLKELCEKRLIDNTVVSFDPSCTTQFPIDGWEIVAPDEQEFALREGFYVWLRKTDYQTDSKTPSYCINYDGVLRKSWDGSPTECSSDSEVVQP